MAAIPSTMLALGTPLPAFALPDTTEPERALVSSDGLDASQGVVVAILCNHCPYVKHVADAVAAFGREVQEQGLAMVAISANDAQRHPDDAPEAMAREAARRGYTFPYLYDESQEVAKAFRAACTPEFYLFDADRKLVYRGQFDDSRPGSDAPVTGADLRAAVAALRAGRPVSEEQKPSIGCNVKWKPGNEPDYT